MDPRIADYIRANRGRYTREAVRERLVEAGHRPEDVDAAWEQLAAVEPMQPQGRTGLSTYIWIVFILGALLIALTIPGLVAFGIGWLLAYLVLAGLAARVLARGRPRSTGETITLVIMAPIVFLLIASGICVATVLVFLSTGGLM